MARSGSWQDSVLAPGLISLTDNIPLYLSSAISGVIMGAWLHQMWALVYEGKHFTSHLHSAVFGLLQSQPPHAHYNDHAFAVHLQEHVDCIAYHWVTHPHVHSVDKMTSTWNKGLTPTLVWKKDFAKENMATYRGVIWARGKGISTWVVPTQDTKGVCMSAKEDL